MADRKKENAVVVSQEQLSNGIYSMWIQTEAAETAKPGQFISMYTNDGTKLLPRPISICEVNEDKTALRIVYRIAGQGTKEFSSFAAGDDVEILGILGNGFPLEAGKGKKVFHKAILG